MHHVSVHALAIAAMCLCAGCSGRSITADNPVVGLVPPRVVAAQDADDPTGPGNTERDIAQVSFENSEGLPQLDAQMSDVAAIVDGTPILVSDVLEPHAGNLVAARQQLSDEKYRELLDQLIRRELPRFVDEVVLMNAALSKLDTEKREQLKLQLDGFFTERLDEIQKQSGASTLAELEAKMQAQGTTLSNLRRAFGRQQLAAQSMQLHRTQDPTVTRPELLAEYEKRIEEYKHPAQVKWQQIWVSYAKHGGKKQAMAVLDRAIAELRNGTDFASVARKYSDGVMAKKGGHWDWTRKGSLANPEVERLLFELSVGEIGQVVAGEKAYQIVRATERLPDRVTPFAEVQGDLRKEIILQKKQELNDDVIKRLKKDAVITTMFDAT